MAGKLRITFADIISAAGPVTVVFERDCTPDELARNPGAASADIEIDAVPDLIIETPTQEGSILSGSDASLSGELQLKLLDTFQPELFDFHNWNVGIGKDVFDKSIDFGLLSLLTEWDVASRVAIGKKSFPPVPVVISYYLIDYTNPKMRAVLEGDAISYDVDFLYGETFHGQLLEDNEYYRYDGSEKTITITAIDYIRWLLLNTSVKDGFMYPGPNPDLFGPQPYNERIESPVGFTKTIASPKENSDAVIVDHWVNGEPWSPFPNPYKYLTLWNVGNEADATNRRRGVAWVGFSIATMMQRLYDRALDTWVAVADRCQWKFYCAGIDPAAFLLGHEDLGVNNDMGPNGWFPYLGTRNQIHEPANHNVITKFRILKSEDDDEEIFLDGSYSTDFFTDIIGHDPFDYSFGHYPSAWEVVTKVPSSFGYRSRYSWRNNVPYIQHFQKTRKPPLVKIGAPISLKATPFGKAIDGVVCKNIANLGKFQTCRRTVTFPSYNIKPMNFTTSRDRGKTAEVKEMYYDDTVITLKWNTEINYYEVYDSRVENAIDPHRQTVLNESSGQVTEPFNLTAPPINAYQCETAFAIMGNFCVPVFGGQYEPGNTESEKMQTGDSYRMETEFMYVPAGTVAEWSLHDRIETDCYGSAYPGLILYAGRDTVDNGMTITTSAQPEGDEYDFYRGAGSIDVPYGDDGTFRKAYSAKSALAIFNMQHHFGRGETQTIVVPGVDVFENELGESGYEAIYEGLGLELGGSLYLISRVAQKSDTGETEIDIQPIPDDVPEMDEETPRLQFADTTTFTPALWSMSYVQYWEIDKHNYSNLDYHQ